MKVVQHLFKFTFYIIVLLGINGVASIFSYVQGNTATQTGGELVPKETERTRQAVDKSYVSSPPPKTLLWLPERKERLIAYNTKLHKVIASLRPTNHNVSLADILGPMFQTAAQRSTNGEDAIEENRALFLMLSAYIKRQTIYQLVGPPEPGEYYVIPRHIRVVLHNRRDLARHFLISAGFTASTNSYISNLLGFFKEMRDSHHGSGFSFTDIVGDRAGTTLADMGLRSGESALKLQQRMQPPLDEKVFMPSVDELPDNLTEAEFTQIFTSPSSKKYQQLDKEIERRIAACPVYQ
ncbi:MAG: hypothetical protein AAF512_18495 [Pseudomonadota bacterium]